MGRCDCCKHRFDYGDLTNVNHWKYKNICSVCLDEILRRFAEKYPDLFTELVDKLLNEK